MFMIIVNKIICFVVGHKWESWATFQTVTEGESGFETMTEKCHRECSRCYHKEYREWSNFEKELLRRHYQHTADALKSGHIGMISGTRFISTRRRK